MILSKLSTLSKNASELLEIPMKGLFLPNIDLSIQNLKKTSPRIFERDVLFDFLHARMAESGSQVVWGGYLEQRLIYNSSPLFHQERNPRCMHLGLDFWAKAGTNVKAPISGVVHSFQDNSDFRDYGPTLILRHEVEDFVFHSLYGHLSRSSLNGIEVGMQIGQGAQIGMIGIEGENGQWPPHLHFQLILDMEGKWGDYPGVCAIEELRHYIPNCPDPRFLLGI